ncbi:MAG: DUF928 domain-containing protein [Leptolyngbyaceae cyanobacterium]
MKQLRKRTALINATGALILGWVGVFPSYAQPQFTTPEDSLIQFLPPPLGDRNRPSDRSRGGASRSSCRVKETQPNLIALIPSLPISVDATEPAAESTLSSYDLENAELENLEPETDGLAMPHPDSGDLNVSESELSELERGELVNPEAESDEFVVSLTTETHPSFWFYMPYAIEEAVALDFIFRDEIGNTLYRTQFTVDQMSPGIVQFSLPATLPPLTIGHTYQWSFATQCDMASANGPLHAKGWIVRTMMDGDLQTQLENVSELEKASLYAAHGIWQDALTTLGELYREDPQNTMLMQNWKSLLTSAGLAEISEQPLIDCCDSTLIEPSLY